VEVGLKLGGAAEHQLQPDLGARHGSCMRKIRARHHAG